MPGEARKSVKPGKLVRVPKPTRRRGPGGKFTKPSPNTGISEERMRERRDIYSPPSDSPPLPPVIRPLTARTVGNLENPEEPSAFARLSPPVDPAICDPPPQPITPEDLGDDVQDNDISDSQVR